MPELSSLKSKIAATEEAEARNVWFRARISAALNDPPPTMPHDEAMAIIDTLVESKRRDLACLGS